MYETWCFTNNLLLWILRWLYLTIYIVYLGIPADHLPNLGTGKHERNKNNNNNNNNQPRTTTTEETTVFRKLTTG